MENSNAKKSGIITIKDVAQRAGIPVRMAARALAGTTQGKRRDAWERAERVHKAAQELGYCPSDIALSLTRGSTRTLGLLVPSLTDMFFAAAAEIAMEEAAEAGYSISIRLTRSLPDLTREALRRFRSGRVDGILFGDAGAGPDIRELNAPYKQNFPMLAFGQVVSDDVSAVIPDRAKALCDAVKYLAGLGHSSVLFVQYRQRVPSDNRIDADLFLAGCASCGIQGEIHFIEKLEQCANLAARHAPALLINGKYAMRAFLDQLPKENGYAPDLIGFYTEWTWTQMSAGHLQGVIMDQAELAVRESVRALIRQIEGQGKQFRAISSAFYAKTDFSRIHVLDLANQYLTHSVRLP